MSAAGTSIAALLQQTYGTGVGLRLYGNQVEVRHASSLPVALYAELRGRCGELWDHLGGAALDQPSLDLLADLRVEVVIPRTIEEAQALLAESERDSDRHTPQALRGRASLLGCDIEVAALPGMEDRPPVKLKKNGFPAKHQPALNSDAALDPHRSRIRLVQLYGGGRRCLVLDTDLVPLEIVAPVLRRRTLVFHNAGYELRFFAAAGIEVPQFDDTMQAAGLLLGAHRRSLDDAALTYLGIELPKGLQRSDWSAPELSPGQYAYAALDAIVALRVWVKLRVELLSKNRGGAYLLQRDVTPAVARMTARGTRLDRAAHDGLIAGWSADLSAAREIFTATTGRPLPATATEVRAYLTEVLPEPLRSQWPRTASGWLSLRASNLRRVAHLPEIRALLDVSAREKLLSAFGTTLQDKISAATGRLHPSYNIASAKTGRASSNGPNIQQLPKKSDVRFRDAIAAANEYVLVVGDFNMMELRAAAAQSRDPVMTADFANGIDLHQQTAAAMLGIPYDDVSRPQRERAKPVNFSMIYGAGAAGLVATAWTNYGVVMSLAEAEQGRQAFLLRYAGYANWMRLNHLQCTQSGTIEIGRLGRVIEAAWEAKPVNRRRRGHWHDDDDDDRDDDYCDAHGWVAGWAEDTLKYTLCCNAPIQGACADASMLALLKVDAALRAAGIDGGVVLFVHDEIVLEVGLDQAEQARAILTACMTQAFAETFPGAPLNGVVSTGVGRSWGGAKP
jgi:DNA polymerase I-like protein with 3'-5' exonuclease and polymerase domains